ncbi:hypothetical protein ACIQGZ_27480 [Streptomyces sp. NPDC092296]|uniref:hypothetical protein n=1 Tax=Streptomyces sp. NPDC092296 TaxID=3366012 RepID=UPI0037FF8551
MKRYELTAEVYRQSYIQDPESGAFHHDWNYSSPEVIHCKARTVRPWDSIESFGKQYEDKEYLEIQTPSQVSLDAQVGRIGNRAGELMWKRDDDRPMLFEVSGCQPSLDRNGRIIEYRVLASLAEARSL